MNKKQKGNATEREVKAILESKGYLVDRARATIKMIAPGKFVSTSLDFFNLFDLICKEPIGKTTTWIQVKGDASDVSKAKPDIEKFYHDWCSHTESVQIWLRIPKKGFIIYNLIGNDWVRSYIDLKGNASEPFLIN